MDAESVSMCWWRSRWPLAADKKKMGAAAKSRRNDDRADSPLQPRSLPRMTSWTWRGDACARDGPAPPRIPGWGAFTSSEPVGGPVFDIGVHILDLTLWLMGSRSRCRYAARSPRTSARAPPQVAGMGNWDPKKYGRRLAGYVRFSERSVARPGGKLGAQRWRRVQHDDLRDQRRSAKAAAR